MHLRPLGHLSRGAARAGRRLRTAERVGFEPTVPSRVHLISNQAPSAARSSLRGGLWQHDRRLSTTRHTGYSRSAMWRSAATFGPFLTLIWVGLAFGQSAPPSAPPALPGTAPAGSAAVPGSAGAVTPPAPGSAQPAPTSS